MREKAMKHYGSLLRQQRQVASPSNDTASGRFRGRIVRVTVADLIGIVSGCIVVIAFAACGCHPSPTARTTNGADTAPIRKLAGGRVLDKSGHPVAGATVTVIGIPRGLDAPHAQTLGKNTEANRVLATCVTDSHGQWAVDQSVLHATMLRVAIEGPQQFWAEDYYVEDAQPDSGDAELTARTLLLDDVRQRRALLKLSSVLEWTPECLVLSKEGSPVSGAEVVVGSGTFAWPEYRGMTDSQGRYRARESIRVEKEGSTLTLCVRAPSFEAAQKQVIVTDSDAGQPAPVFRLRDGRQLVGHVCDESGRPLVGASVLLVDRRPKIPIQSWLVVDNAGGFHAKGLPNSGRLLLVVAANSREFEPVAAEIALRDRPRGAIRIVVKQLDAAKLKISERLSKAADRWSQEGLPTGQYPPWRIGPEHEGAPTEILFVTPEMELDGGIPQALTPAFFRCEGDPEAFALLHYNRNGGANCQIPLSDFIFEETTLATFRSAVQVIWVSH